MDDDNIETIGRRYAGTDYPELKSRRTLKEWFLTVAVPFLQGAAILLIFAFIWDKVV